MFKLPSMHMAAMDVPLDGRPGLSLLNLLLQVCFAIAITAILGVLVSLSTFLAIGSTSSVMFNGESLKLDFCSSSELL